MRLNFEILIITQVATAVNCAYDCLALSRIQLTPERKNSVVVQNNRK